MNHAMNTASSPCPTQTLGKGPGHTCKNSRMCCVSSLCLESPPITKFLTHDVIQRPFENGKEANSPFANLKFKNLDCTYAC